MRHLFAWLFAIHIALSASPATADDDQPTAQFSQTAVADEHALGSESTSTEASTTQAVRRYDYWQLMLDGFALKPLAVASVDDYTRLYSSNLNFVMQALQRASPYISNIIDTLMQRGMPGELALLPVIESGYNPAAVSPAAAAGIWQFIPQTGRRYGLQQDWLHDERRTPLAATDAALTYLQTLYAQFGDWHLALAAYNCGENCVSRAVEQARQAKRSSDFAGIAPYLPAETRAYVPRLIAVSNILQGYRQRTASLPRVAATPRVVKININTPSDLDSIAKLSGITVDELAVLNAGSVRHVIPAGSTLWLPSEGVAKLRLTVSASPPDIDQATLFMGLKALKAMPGETLAAFAARCASSIDELRRINGIGQGLNKIASGTLFVKRKGDEPPFAGDIAMLEPLKMVGDEVLLAKSATRTTDNLLLAHHPDIVNSGWVPGRLSLRNPRRR